MPGRGSTDSVPVLQEKGIKRKPMQNQWVPKMAVGDMLDMLRSERESLPSLIEDLDEQAAEQRSTRLLDTDRMQIVQQLLELLQERSNSRVGLLQSTVVSMLANTGFDQVRACFFSKEEIDSGCATGPSMSLAAATSAGVDDRLVVTLDTLERILEAVPNAELVRLLSAYSDIVQASDVAWQVTMLEKRDDAWRNPQIKCASGIAVWGSYAYVTDAQQHMVFRVNLLTDETAPFCGKRGHPGKSDGAREAARFRSPGGVAVFGEKKILYICDTGNNSIRLVHMASAHVHTLAFVLKEQPQAFLQSPVGICLVRGDFDLELPLSAISEHKDNAEEAAEKARGTVKFTEPLAEERGTEEAADGAGEEDDRRGRGGDPKSRRMMNRSYTQKYALEGSEMSTKLANAPAALGSRHASPQLRRRADDGSRSSMHLRSSLRDSRASVSALAVTGYQRKGSQLSEYAGESAMQSMKECTQGEQGELQYCLAVTGDHCVYLLRPDRSEAVVLAGDPAEYGYRDADRGAEARFSSLRGVTCVQSCLFVADYWNNAVRCINMATGQVDTVIDFHPSGPTSLAVSASGSVYVLDSQHISVCNVLKVRSSQCPPEKDEDDALGAATFQQLQAAIGEEREEPHSRHAFHAFTARSDVGSIAGLCPGRSSPESAPRLHPVFVEMANRPRRTAAEAPTAWEPGPELFCASPRNESPWKRIPIGSLPHAYQEATGRCCATMPLALAHWSAAEANIDAAPGLHGGPQGARQLLVGGSEWPAVLKVLPPLRSPPQANGRFRAVAVDRHRVVVADSDSNQICMVNHRRNTKEKIAGCGKAGYFDGPLDVCRLNRPSSVALDPSTHFIYVADTGNHRVRCIDLATGFMSTICGNGVKGNCDGNELKMQSLDSPFDIHFMPPGHLLISCADNSIRRLDLKTSQLETVLVGC